MCNSCGCSSPDEWSRAEQLKGASRHLRGSITAELQEPTRLFSEDAIQILKFHGVYQQDDRDRRKEARALGLDKHHMMMIRTRVPGGVVSPSSYLAHDAIAGDIGNGTMRLTTRQDFQLHGVLKADLKEAMQRINDGLLTTLGGCGDQERNIMCCPAPLQDPVRDEVQELLPRLVAGLTPTTRAYVEIWLDGELAASSQDDPPDELYGEHYLPRKFKTALAIEGDNCVDVYANDLGLVARRDEDGGLAGFDVLVGGGLGRTANKPNTWPAVAKQLGFIAPEDAIEVARAVMSVQRDYGNRADRRHARMKYLIADRGIDWFRDQVEARLGCRLPPPRTLRWSSAADHLGWHEQSGANCFYGLFVENGRIRDEGSEHLRTAVREIVEQLSPRIVLTPQQNVIFAGLRAEQHEVILETLLRHGVTPTEAVPGTILNSMACPAWPTCGLAVAEAERAMPTLIRELTVLQESAGLATQPISIRMTGCPNGCARPYLGDVGFVGTTLGKYDVFLGGDTEGTRLNQLYAHNVPLAQIPELLRGPLEEYSRTRHPGEGFGDWCARHGVEGLSEHYIAAEGIA